MIGQKKKKNGKIALMKRIKEYLIRLNFVCNFSDKMRLDPNNNISQNCNVKFFYWFLILMIISIYRKKKNEKKEKI